jgi:hypothetical protein
MSKSLCKSYQTCEELLELLQATGFGEDASPLCNGEGEWPCEGMIANARLLYTSVKPDTVKDTLIFVSKLFKDKSALYQKDMQELTKDAEFSCPEMGIDIYQPCSVTSCAFYTDNEWTNNCILCYRLRYGHEMLSLNDLSVLLKVDVVSLRTLLNKSLKSLSHGALKETIAQDGADEMITYLDVDRVCSVCETPIPDGTAPLVKSNFTYCSDECYRYKPPVVLRIERDFGLPISNVLNLCIKKFSNLKSMASAIGVGQPVFLNLCSRYGVVVPTSILA